MAGYSIQQLHKYIYVNFINFDFRLSRRNQVYNFPILLSEEVMPSPLFYATVTPLFAWLLIKKLVIDPIKREQQLKTKEKQKEANKNRFLFAKATFS